jgi:hypothetical protein
MKPEMEKSTFIIEDESSYRIPEIYFAGEGETDHPQKVVEWSEDSVIVAKGNRVVKYTECVSYELLMRDEDGQESWVEGTLADCMGWDIENAEGVRKVKNYLVEEYDFDQLKKRKYRVDLEAISEISPYDYAYFENVVGRRYGHNNFEYDLAEK